MAIRAFFGYDDVPLPATEQLTTFSPLPLPFVFKSGNIAGGTGVTYVKEDGWFKCKGSVNGSGTAIVKTNYMGCTLQALGITPSAGSVITIGMRWVCPTNSLNAADWPAPISIFRAAISNANQTVGSAFPFNGIPGWVPGKEYYLEAQYDAPASVIRRRIDGVAQTDLVMSAETKLSVTGGAGLFYSGQMPVSKAGTFEYTWWFKDMYVIEKTVDGTADDFLGPQHVIPISVASIDQATWPAAGAADAVSGLNAAVTDTASLAAPTVTSDVLNPVANLGLALPSFSGQVNAVSLSVIGRRSDGASGNVGGQVVVGPDTSVQVNAALTNVMAAGNKLYQGEKAPNGTRWTRTSLLASKLKLITG